jgi:putative SOS response-associated peptidase YedK
MCGRFTLHTLVNRILLECGIEEISWEVKPRYNIAPSQDIPVIRQQDGQRRIDPMRWGLIPAWAKDPKIGYTMINARSETAAEKPSFRAAMKYRRCLIPADGFYQWKKEITTPHPTPFLNGSHPLPRRERAGVRGEEVQIRSINPEILEHSSEI